MHQAWKPVFEDKRSHSEVEDRIVAGDRLFKEWRYDWGDGHVRGVDIMVVRDAKVAEKRSYVKG